MGLRVLNLYAGIGGNRKLWTGCDVVAVENEQYIADAYKALYPNDEVIVADAHQYLLDHHKEFDFIWSSPPCPTHSVTNSFLYAQGVIRYPDMGLYQEIILLKHRFKGLWCVENVKSYYDPLIHPTATIDRHYYWSNFAIPPMKVERKFNVARARASTRISNEDYGKALEDFHKIYLPKGTKNQRKLLRNAVMPEMGLHIFNAAQTKQGVLL
jgi:DNA (cytosine-5)-methyltransferase 1